MAVEEDGHSILHSQIILDSFASKQSEELLSPEDQAWVDSCLVQEAEILETSWSYVRDALLEALSSQPDAIDTTMAKGDEYSVEDHTANLSPSEKLSETMKPLDFQTVSSQPDATNSTMAEGDGYLVEDDTASCSSFENPSRTIMPSEFQNAVADPFQFDKEETENENLGSDNSQPQTSGRNVFRPNYSEFPEESLSTSLEFNLPPPEIEFSADKIFKVWDLDVPDEDDEFAKQLNKALGQSSLQSASTDNLALWKEVNDGSLDDLVAGLGDLSLS